MAVLKEVLREGFISETEKKGAYLREGLLALQHRFPRLLKEVRGLGLIQGIELTGDGLAIQRYCAAGGLLVNCIAGKVLRLLPPLTVNIAEIDAALKIMEESLAQHAGEAGR
ncbi:MAG TPA: hypothetical protein DCQ14_03005 [Firmicutes bacterium]|nr:hypothetical protein [Bacillota bacterium]